MRIGKSAKVLSLILGLSVSGVAGAEAAKVRSSKPQSREAVYANCRKQIYRKYGWNGHDGKRYLRRDFWTKLADHCVANGGKVI